MDKKQLMVIEKYTQPFVQLVFEKGEQDLVFEKLTQIKGIFEETGLDNFLAHIGVEDEEKAKSLLLSNAFVVTVTTVAGLDPVQEQKLIPIIERKFGIQVRSIQQKIDPDLIGGFVVTANHKTLDTSLKHQLQVIKSKLK